SNGQRRRFGHLRQGTAAAHQRDAARTPINPLTWAIPAPAQRGPRISPKAPPAGRDLQPLLNHSRPGPETAYLTGKPLTGENTRLRRRRCRNDPYDARRAAATMRNGPDLGF